MLEKHVPRGDGQRCSLRGSASSDRPVERDVATIDLAVKRLGCDGLSGDLQPPGPSRE